MFGIINESRHVWAVHVNAPNEKPLFYQLQNESGINFFCVCASPRSLLLVSQPNWNFCLLGKDWMGPMRQIRELCYVLGLGMVLWNGVILCMF